MNKNPQIKKALLILIKTLN